METEARKTKIVTRRLEKPRLDVQYPQVVGMGNRLVKRKINHSILDAVYGLIQRQGYVGHPEKTVTGSYQIKLHKNGVLSLLYASSGYAQGAAHGIVYRSSQTFHLDDATEYKLADLFKPGSFYIARLNVIIKQELKEREKEQDLPLLKEFSTIAADQPFYLTERAIGVYFQLEEYTPYAVFEVPYVEVFDILNSDGPVGLMT
ncbi:DUF3298 and DUF4163 domain-containing protein [Paenibacillus cremeus]|uniref:DUF3298 and DUF4163 domain-containing protein n=2 Tax=Paenibacillus cremeus TaxID=2163881 RepID=A0A559K435_9BACL|nr:DUF3298 and DUF4163 domain-containing protein [Paenibacillus cremeus]